MGSDPAGLTNYINRLKKFTFFFRSRGKLTVSKNAWNVVLSQALEPALILLVSHASLPKPQRRRKQRPWTLRLNLYVPTLQRGG